MGAEGFSRDAGFNHVGAVELACTWCDANVPLPQGEYSSVCINCGTVLFRECVHADGASGQPGSPPLRRIRQGAAPARSA